MLNAVQYQRNCYICGTNKFRKVLFVFYSRSETLHSGEDTRARVDRAPYNF